MTTIDDALTDLGLSATESAIYLTGLGFSAVSVRELEKQTRIKRTTIYHALNTLGGKGLVASKSSGARLLFTMTRPEHLERAYDKKISRLEEQKDVLKNIIPLLSQRTKVDAEEMRVTHHEGIEGIKTVVEEALYCHSRHWDIIAPAKNFFSDFNKVYADYFMNARRKRQIISRSLWESSTGRRRLGPTEIRERNPRFLPESLRGKFQSVIILFDDKIAIISSLRTASAVLIQSAELSATFNAFFEGLWLLSVPYTKSVQ